MSNNQLKENKTNTEIAEVLNKFLTTRKDGIFKEGIGAKYDESVVIDYINKNYTPNTQVQSEKEQYLREFVDFVERALVENLKLPIRQRKLDVNKWFEQFISQKGKE